MRFENRWSEGRPSRISTHLKNNSFKQSTELSLTSVSSPAGKPLSARCSFRDDFGYRLTSQYLGAGVDVVKSRRMDGTPGKYQHQRIGRLELDSSHVPFSSHIRPAQSNLRPRFCSRNFSSVLAQNFAVGAGAHGGSDTIGSSLLGLKLERRRIFC